MGDYWNRVGRRAFAEAKAEIRWDSPVRIVTGVFAPVVSGLVVWYTTGKPAWAGLVTIVVVGLVGVVVFVTKILALPGKLEAEHEAEANRAIAQLEAQNRVVADHIRTQENQRRTDMVTQIFHYYLATHDGISSEMMAGLEMPPQNWINQQLITRGENFQVRVLGHQFQTIDRTLAG